HMDYLESEIAPNLMRFIKSKIGSKRVTSYYNFLKYIGEENLPLFTEEENILIDLIEELLPIVRVDEYLIINYLLNHNEIKVEEIIGYNSRVNLNTVHNAVEQLTNKGILKDGRFSLDNISNIKTYLLDLVNYGINKYEVEFGDFKGDYKLYSNYTKEQTMTSINKEFKMNIRLKGTYIDEETGDTYIWVGLKKDKAKKERTDYKDKFISPIIFQWESENNTTQNSSIGKKLLNSNKVYLFVRKMDDEDNIILPFTYFGIGRFENVRDSKVIDQKTKAEYKTLLFDIKLDKEVPAEYWIDFEIPEKVIDND
ncbi:MAG: DUF3427 domain-containing protein, partial [Tenericutes bacterium]|nr:DUF3427 domain-containing protein [Mycoplasmatota bacterium]